MKNRYISPMDAIHIWGPARLADTLYGNFILTTSTIIYVLLISSTIVNSGKNKILLTI